MAKIKPDISGYDEVGSYIISRLLTKESKVLFIYEKDYNKVLKLVNNCNISATIMGTDFDELEKARSFGFDVILGNINTDVLYNLEPKSYDFIVAENVISSSRFLGDTLVDFTNLANNVILGQKNHAHWAKRVRYFFSGSHFVKNQYLVVPNDSNAWFNKDPWILSHKDIVNLCACYEITIKQGVIVYKNGYIDNMYDMRSYPNLYAHYMYYCITNEDNGIIPSYKIGGLNAI